MEFSRQEYWSVLPGPPPGDLPNPGILCLLHWQVGPLPLAPPGCVYLSKGFKIHFKKKKWSVGGPLAI